MAQRIWSPTMSRESVDPDDITDYVFDFAALLEGDPIIGTPTTVPVACTAVVTSNTATTVTVRVSSVSVGDTAQVTVRVTTASGQRYDRTLPFTGVQL